MGSAMFLGCIIGNLFIGSLGDFWGRRKTLLLCWFASTLAVINLIFSYHKYQLLAGFFFLGLFFWPIQNLGVIMISEQSSNQ